MTLSNPPTSFKHLSLGLVLLVAVLWFELSLGVVLVSFWLLLLLASESSWPEKTIFSLVASFILSLWFVVSWPVVVTWLWLGILTASWLKKQRFRLVYLSPAVVLSLGFMVLAQIHLSAGLWFAWALELVMMLVVLPRDKL